MMAVERGTYGLSIEIIPNNSWQFHTFSCNKKTKYPEDSK